MLKNFLRTVSLMLCALMLTASAGTAVYALPSDGSFVFDSTADVRLITGIHSLDVSYSENEDAAMLKVNSGDPYFSLDLSSAGLDAGVYKYMLMVYKAPNTNSSMAKQFEVFPCAGNVAVPTAGYSKIFTLKTGSYTSEIIDLSALSWWRGTVHSLRIDPFCSASAGDTMYLDSVILCKSREDAENAAKSRIAERTGTNPYLGSDYVCTAYDTAKYTSPLWAGGIVYNEAVYPVMDKDGNAAYTLMYTPDKVMCLCSSDFSTYYTEGKDYTVNGNKLTILKTGSVPLVSYSHIHRTSDGYKHTAAGDGLYEFWGSRSEFFNGYLNITYTHSDTWKGHLPAQKSNKLPRTASAIQNKGSMKIVYFGDSICGGADTSSYRNVYPYAEWWNEQITSKLKKDFGCNVSAVYSSEGGSTAADMVGAVYNCVIQHSPDLVFIEYGANDAMNASQNSDYSASRLKGEFKSGIRQMIDTIRRSLPNCEIVLVAPAYCNPYCHYQSYFDACRDALNELEASYSGVAVADVTAMHNYMLSFKNFLDMSGDNMCHPNDFMSRIFAQVCLEAIVPGGLQAYVPTGELPDVGNPTVKPSSTYSHASPDGHGWYWPQTDAYGRISGYGENGQDIILDFDLCLLPSADETPSTAKLWAPGDDCAIFISTDHVSIAGNTAEFNWGNTTAGNWRRVSIKIKNGAASVSIDGNVILSVPNGISARTSDQLLFSQYGSMMIDNISMRSERGVVYFNCDFENRNAAQNILGSGLGKYTELNVGTVRYDLCGGSGSILNQIKVDGIPLRITDNMPEKAGYNFIGWSTDSSATKIDLRAGDLYTVDGSATLYAVWENINVAPKIESITPKSADINGTGSVTYTMIAAGDGLTYQWRCVSDNADKINISGENSLSLTVSIDASQTESFKAAFVCTVTNKFGLSVTSDEVYLNYTGVAPDILVGDVNDDGKVNSKDSNLMKRMILGVYVPGEEEFRRADIFEDNVINIKDTNMLKRILAGIS